MSDAHDERMSTFSAQWRGRQGDQGKKGDKGDAGKLPRPVRRAIVWLFLASCAFSLLGDVVLFRYINQNNTQSGAGAAAAVARSEPLLKDARSVGNPSRQALNTIIKADRARAKRLHCGS